MRARRQAGETWCERCAAFHQPLACPIAAALGEDQVADAVEAQFDAQFGSTAEFVAPLGSRPPDRDRTHAGARRLDMLEVATSVTLQEVEPRFRYGAALALERLIASIEAGDIRGKDLAVACSILTDKAHKLRDLAPEPTTGAADLDTAAAEIARLQAELKRRP